MPPRRGQGDIVGGRPAWNATLLQEIRPLRTRMEAMETTQRREPDVGGNSDEEALEVTKETKFLRMLVKVGGITKVEVHMYEGNLNVEELMDWINTMDKYFDFEEIEDKNKVKYEATSMEGHVAIWWDEVQIYRERKGKSKIKKWDKMVRKIKSKFMLKDYQLNVFRQLQNLRQKDWQSNNTQRSFTN